MGTIPATLEKLCHELAAIPGQAYTDKLTLIDPQETVVKGRRRPKTEFFEDWHLVKLPQGLIPRADTRVAQRCFTLFGGTYVMNVVYGTHMTCQVFELGKPPCIFLHAKPGVKDVRAIIMAQPVGSMSKIEEMLGALAKKLKT